MILTMRVRGLVAIVASVLFAGCAEEPDQTIVVLDADEAALEGAAQLRVQVCDASGGLRHDQTVPLSAVSFPEAVPINPLGGDRSRVFGFEATLLADDGLALQSQRVFASFPGGRSEVTRRFEGDCADVDCPLNQTCVGGGCEAAAALGLIVGARDAEVLLACVSQEQCNGSDDDGDGAIDEGDDPEVQPTVCSAAMGRSEIADGWYTAAPDRSRVNSVTLSDCEDLGPAYIYLDGQGPEGTYQPFRVLIYSSGSDGEPAGLLAVTEEVRVDGGTGPMWYRFDRWERPAGALTLESGEYWLGFIAGSAVGHEAEDALYNNVFHDGVKFGRFGEDDYLTGPAETFVEDEERTLDRELTLFVACAP